MTGKGRNRGHSGPRNRNDHTLSSVARETAASLSADSPVLAAFMQAAAKLTERQDRHERLVKLSRDITIESKRIIFLLHSVITRELSTKVVDEAKQRIQKLINGPIKGIALELENSPAYLHWRAVTAGFQEFIEARTLCSLMENGEIISYSEVQKELVHTIPEGDKQRTAVTQIPQVEYILGLADLSGELMRKAINSIASGDSEDCFFACQVVRQLFAGFLGLQGAGKEVGRKLSTTRANVWKVESAAYALRVRGGEAPPALLLAAPPAHAHWEPGAGAALHEDDDEGYY